MAAADRPNRFGAAVTKRTAPEPTPGSVGEKHRKYTILLSNAVSMDLDEDMVALSRQAGRRVDKSEVLRALVDLLHTDPALMSQVAERLRPRG